MIRGGSIVMATYEPLAAGITLGKLRHQIFPARVLRGLRITVAAIQGLCLGGSETIV
jgi:hypothetical protein